MYICKHIRVGVFVHISGCVYMCIYQGGCICTHIRVCVYVRISGWVYIYAYQGGFICTHIRVGVYVHISGSVYMYAYQGGCICTHIRVCVYVHISGLMNNCTRVYCDMFAGQVNIANPNFNFFLQFCIKNLFLLLLFACSFVK